MNNLEKQVKRTVSPEVSQAYQIVARDMGNNLIAKIGSLYSAIQENRDISAALKDLITNPFADKEETPKETVVEAEVIKDSKKSHKWDKMYEQAMIHASLDSTSNSKRTLEYLETTLPFSKDAIRRKAYRMGFKWKNGKLVNARA